mmetsp:Transcript_5775/g.16270  ORF Transcript_5775/g.16270 Transcript_5775/m.16270 type:complete len:644 (+) Transcript_5775:165-2096(+)|eukprot:CAMPEP_0181058470 /NCGR_PEP_ID=MMETSP1070-20121207/20840_1 /TAXON_ID=265543 /ORGANISM="Minutocellus polymorphus, Strain NH13" /LENGTH=643 /DNA_ID=CAMNT_0023138031 /DNA_START=85 /DNA_END=2016 /DNA_ORIENTATION=+
MPRPGPANRNRRRSNVGGKKSALTERLEEIVVFELGEDGNREYRTMTLRGLYNYVMKCITHRPSIQSAIECGGGASSTCNSGGPGRPTRSFSLQRCTSEGEAQFSPQIGPRASLTRPTRLRSGSVSVDNSTRTMPPPPLFSESCGNSQQLPPAVNSLGSSGQPSPWSSTRSVRFHPLTPGGANDVNGGEGEGQEGGGDGDASNLPENTHVTFRERLGGYLHPRDMRRLVTPFSSSNEPALIVRRHVMLLNFDPLRAIVLRDRLLVLVPDGADSILISLEKKLKGGIKELEKSIFGEDKSMTSSTMGSDASEVGGSSEAEETGVKNGDTPESGDHTHRGRDDATGLDVTSPLAQNLLSDHQTIQDEQKSSSKFGSDGDDEGGSRGTTSTETVEDLDYEGEEEWDEIENRIYLDLPFELQAVDAVLSCVSSLLSADASELRHKVYIAMAALRGDSRKSTPGDHAQEKLRILKDSVGEMEARVQGFVRALNLVLDEDEDMSLMNLSRLITHPERFIQPVSQEILEEESDEPELLLESYMQQSLSAANTLELLKGQITSTEELVTMKLDAIRNRLLYISTMVSIASLCVATASLIGSIFGMNLLNNLENDPNAFAQVLAGTLLGSIGMFILISFWAYRSGVLPQGVL